MYIESRDLSSRNGLRKQLRVYDSPKSRSGVFLFFFQLLSSRLEANNVYLGAERFAFPRFAFTFLAHYTGRSSRSEPGAIEFVQPRFSRSEATRRDSSSGNSRDGNRSASIKWNFAKSKLRAAWFAITAAARFEFAFR